MRMTRDITVRPMIDRTSPSDGSDPGIFDDTTLFEDSFDASELDKMCREAGIGEERILPYVPTPNSIRRESRREKEIGTMRSTPELARYRWRMRKELARLERDTTGI